MSNLDGLRVSVSQEFEFHAAHFLSWHPGKCANLHGHSYRVQVNVEGPLDHNGIVIDFDQLAEIVWKRVIEPLDHSLLNDHIENPTAERLAVHIMQKLEDVAIRLSEVRVWETAQSCATVRRSPE
ncbi:6-carboxytetrahydropterin synthase QueD [Plantibacter flavus]|uniref:6-carboxytetrahydropterin synthase QueD n=1 Tax=Plantibacter flavus TaxID=150123 RepID=UPI0010C23486|nr:6-carboxytetrahydropterin synthase QueD [Plantibacter flavus]TKJ95542.1 6-carboxytetrahydropterin synthase QueD [Plantibacter flavus]